MSKNIIVYWTCVQTEQQETDKDSCTFWSNGGKNNPRSIFENLAGNGYLYIMYTKVDM